MYTTLFYRFQELESLVGRRGCLKQLQKLCQEELIEVLRFQRAGVLSGSSHKQRVSRRPGCGRPRLEVLRRP